jgi:hypothetical protein
VLCSGTPRAGHAQRNARARPLGSACIFAGLGLRGCPPPTENLGTACPPDCSARLSQCLADISDCRHTPVYIRIRMQRYTVLYTQEMGVMVVAEKNMAGIGGRAWP